MLPLASLFLSDVCLQLFTDTKGFYGRGQFFVYGAFMLVTWLATYIRKVNVANIAFAAVWSGLVFFIVSNFGQWLWSTLYPKTLAGLAAGYWAGIPFYNGEFFGSFLFNSIFGNLFFSALLFGAYYFIQKMEKLQKSVA